MANIFPRLKREVIKGIAKLGLRQVNSNYLGMPLRVPVVHGVVNSGYIIPAEFWMGQCLKTFIETKSGTVIDIGVNAGLYLVKLRQLCAKREYVGFEPNPSCNLYSQELIRLNGFEAACIYPIALSEHNGTARFYATEIGDKTGSLVYEHKSHETLDHSFDVVTMTGDWMINMLDMAEISAIKIDVEEAELSVLRGLRDTIAKHRPYIYCEILASAGESVKEQRAEQIYQLISSNNYATFGLIKHKSTVVRIRDVAEIGGQFEQEYIFCPNELIDAFCSAIQTNAEGITIDDGLASYKN